MSHQPVYDGAGREVRFGDIYYLYHSGSGEYIRQLGRACVLTTPKDHLYNDPVRTAMCVVGSDYGFILGEDKKFSLIDVETDLFLTNVHDKLELSREPGVFKVFRSEEPYIYLNINNERLHGPTPYGDLIFDKKMDQKKKQEYEFEFINIVNI